MVAIARPIARWFVQARYPTGTNLLPILMYHRVLKEPDPLQPDVPDIRQMAEQFRALAGAFQVLRLHEAAEMLREVRDCVAEHFEVSIHHSTFQIETEHIAAQEPAVLKHD